MKKIMILIFSFLLIKCGLPSADSLEDLNPPSSLEKVGNGYTCTGVGGVVTSIDITFYGYNNEQFFSGYNVYIVEQVTQPTSYDSKYNLIKGQVNNHLLESSRTATENKYIFNYSSDNQIPTYSKTSLASDFPLYDDFPTQITLTLTVADHLPEEMNAEDDIKETYYYYIGVTAYSSNGNQGKPDETEPSNFIELYIDC